MLNLPAATWIRFIVWMAVGLVVYFLYGRSHSRVRPGGEHTPDAPASAAGAPASTAGTAPAQAE